MTSPFHGHCRFSESPGNSAKPTSFVPVAQTSVIISLTASTEIHDAQLRTNCSINPMLKLRKLNRRFNEVPSRRNYFF